MMCLFDTPSLQFLRDYIGKLIRVPNNITIYVRPIITPIPTSNFNHSSIGGILIPICVSHYVYLLDQMQP